MISAREAAFFTLVKTEENEGYSNIETDSQIKKHSLTGAERGLFTTLVYGVIERKITLDYFISKLSSIRLSKIEKKILTILRIGAYQILYLDRIPDHAAVNEAVEMAKVHSNKGAASYVNGVLRSVIRQKDTLEYPTDPFEFLSVKYSLPVWLCKMWYEQYGEDTSLKIMEGVNTHPYMTLRVNTLKTTREELFDKIIKSGIKAEYTEISPFGIRLNENTPISELPFINEGLCFVQDEASQLCINKLSPKGGETVIDTCCCPGGKSFSTAIEMKNTGKIYSFDLHQSKLSLVEKGAKKLGITIIETKAHNSSKPEETLTGKADRVLCDVPCSGLGVIAKKPDIRHKREDDLKRLPDIQYAILSASSHYVKEKGVLVYSTCTLNKKENEEVVLKFTEENKDFSLKEKITLIPDCNGTDGFFIALMERTKS